MYSGQELILFESHVNISYDWEATPITFILKAQASSRGVLVRVDTPVKVWTVPFAESYNVGGVRKYTGPTTTTRISVSVLYNYNNFS